MIAPTITRSSDPIYGDVAIGSSLIRQLLRLDDFGRPILTRVYSQPQGGTFQTSSVVQGEKRNELQPIGPLPITIRPEFVAGVLATGAAARQGGDRRGVDRGDRDPRMLKTPADEANAPGKERRTGGPLSSLLTEVKAFFMTPAGIAVAGLASVGILVYLVRR